MAQEKIACPFCGGLGGVGSICEYCGSVIQLSTPMLEKGFPKTEKKTISGEQYAEKISKYQTVGEYHGKLAIVSIGQRFGLIDRNGDLRVGLEYDNIVSTIRIEGLFAICRKGKWALLNDDCKFLIDFQFDDIRDIGYEEIGRAVYNPKGLSKVKLKGKWGIINSNGVEILPCIYDERGIIPLFCKDKTLQYDKYIKVAKDGKYGVFDVSGREIYPCIHFFIRTCGNGERYITFTKMDGESFVSGLYDMNTYQEVLPRIYSFVSDFLPNVIVSKEGKNGVYNIESKTEILPCVYDKVIMESNWIKAGIKLGNGENWGLFKLTGEEIVPCRYDRIESKGTSKFDLYYGMEDIGVNHFFTIKMDGDRIVEKGSPKIFNGWSVFWSVLCLLGAIFFISSFGFFSNKFVLALILCLLAVPAGCIWKALVIRRYKI